MTSRSRIPFAPILFGIAAIVAVYLAFGTARYVVHNYRLHQQEDELGRELKQLDRDHEQLTAVRDYLKSDEYIEDVARRVLGLVRPGETLVIVSGIAPAPDAATPAAPGSPDAPWWKDLFVAPAEEPSPTPVAP